MSTARGGPASNVRGLHNATLSFHQTWTISLQRSLDLVPTQCSSHYGLGRSLRNSVTILTCSLLYLQLSQSTTATG
jgi:hypothetical protein